MRALAAVAAGPIIGALRMRPAAWFLLLLTLPGLLLPAGLLLHVCRCEALAARATATCCQPDTSAAASAERSQQDCCRRSPVAPAAPREAGDAGVPTNGADPCACVWVPAPETRQDQAPPDQPVAAPELGVLRAPLELLVWPASPPARNVLAAAVRAPPPPDHARNLPLRL